MRNSSYDLSSYWDDHSPYEPDGVGLSGEDIEVDDDYVDRYVEKKRGEYRRAFRSYLKDFEENHIFLDYKDYLV